MQNISPGTSEINYVYRKLLISPVDKIHLGFVLMSIWKHTELFIKWKLKISMCETMSSLSSVCVGNDMTYANLHNLRYSYKTNFYFFRLSTNRHKEKRP